MHSAFAVPSTLSWFKVKQNIVYHLFSRLGSIQLNSHGNLYFVFVTWVGLMAFYAACNNATHVAGVLKHL